MVAGNESAGSLFIFDPAMPLKDGRYVFERGFGLSLSAAVGPRIAPGFDGPQARDIRRWQSVLDCPGNHERLVPMIGLPRCVCSVCARNVRQTFHDSSCGYDIDGCLVV